MRNAERDANGFQTARYAETIQRWGLKLAAPAKDSVGPLSPARPPFVPRPSGLFPLQFT